MLVVSYQPTQPAHRLVPVSRQFDLSLKALRQLAWQPEFTRIVSAAAK